MTDALPHYHPIIKPTGLSEFFHSCYFAVLNGSHMPLNSWTKLSVHTCDWNDHFEPQLELLSMMPSVQWSSICETLLLSLIIFTILVLKSFYVAIWAIHVLSRTVSFHRAYRSREINRAGASERGFYGPYVYHSVQRSIATFFGLMEQLLDM